MTRTRLALAAVGLVLAAAATVGTVNLAQDVAPVPGVDTVDTADRPAEVTGRAGRLPAAVTVHPDDVAADTADLDAQRPTSSTPRHHLATAEAPATPPAVVVEAPAPAPAPVVDEDGVAQQAPEERIGRQTDNDAGERCTVTDVVDDVDVTTCTAPEEDPTPTA